MRGCNTCQHVKGREIDRRLANGEPVAQVARDYELSVSSVHRHRVNCSVLAPPTKSRKKRQRSTLRIISRSMRCKLLRSFGRIAIVQSPQSRLLTGNKYLQFRRIVSAVATVTKNDRTAPGSLGCRHTTRHHCSDGYNDCDGVAGRKSMQLSSPLGNFRRPRDQNCTFEMCYSLPRLLPETGSRVGLIRQRHGYDRGWPSIFN